MINPLSRGDCTRFLASDGNKASIPPPHRAGTVPGFLSNVAKSLLQFELGTPINEL